MIDNVNPTNQFHPYVPVDTVPQAEGGGLSHLDKARGYARQHPGFVLGGLAALAIGLGMLRGRSLR